MNLSIREHLLTKLQSDRILKFYFVYTQVLMRLSYTVMLWNFYITYKCTLAGIYNKSQIKPLYWAADFKTNLNSWDKQKSP